MGRQRKYATEEEAHEAKKQQMRENYQKRKAAKETAKDTKPKTTPKKEKKAEPLKFSDDDELGIHTPPQAEYLQMTKEELLEKFVGFLANM